MPGGLVLRSSRLHPLTPYHWQNGGAPLGNRRLTSRSTFRLRQVRQWAASESNGHEQAPSAFASTLLFSASALLSAGLLFGLPAAELFEPMQYVGRWYEVASLKKGFAGEGQQDCHCTQGVYMPVKNKQNQIKLEVSTFCFHGGPDGRLSGIRGDVTCADPLALSRLPEFETDFEQRESIREKCVLRFPQIPFVPPEPYDVIRTDYKTYALVQGAQDTSFVQIYSRTPNPGKAFIEEQKSFLGKYGYPVKEIKETPQDCDEIPMETLMTMMKGEMMEAVLTNTAPEEEVDRKVQFEGPRNLVKSARDLISLFVPAGAR